MYMSNLTLNFLGQAIFAKLLYFQILRRSVWQNLMTWEAPALRTMCRCKEGGDKYWVGSLSNDHDIANVNENGKKARLANNLVPRALPLKNGWGGKRPWHRLVTCPLVHPFFREKPWGRGWLTLYKCALNCLYSAVISNSKLDYFKFSAWGTWIAFFSRNDLTDFYDFWHPL